jgi:hypothetical protein
VKGHSSGPENQGHAIFHVDGGIGKNIMATAVASAIKREHPDRKLVVVSSWPVVWINNPDIYRFYANGMTPYFYEDYIKDKDVIILKSEPYHHQDFINKKRCLPDIWCEQLGVTYDNDPTKIILTIGEKEKIKRKLEKFKKPILALQTNGGGPEQEYPISWVRDAPVENLIKPLNEISKTYDIIHIRKENQPHVDGIDFMDSENLRDLFALIAFSSRRLFIDSFAQHAAKALGKPSTVLWPVDNVKTLGYPDFHHNIVSKAPKRKVHLIDSYFSDAPIDGSNTHENPFDTNFIFDEKAIENSVLHRRL